MLIFSIFSSRSNKWTKVRKDFLRTNNSCSACGVKEKLEVHHIEPFHINPSRELDVSNLITLCKSCHFVFGHLMDYSSWNDNVSKDSFEYLQKIKNRPYKIISLSQQTLYQKIISYFYRKK